MVLFIFFVILFLFLSFLSLIEIMIEKDIESPPYKFDCIFSKKISIKNITVHQLEHGIKAISKLFF